MKHPILLLSFRSLRISIKHYVLMTLLFTFISFFFVFESILIGSYLKSLSERRYNTFGTQDAIIAFNDFSEYQEVKKSNYFDCIGVIKSYGNFILGNGDNLNVGTYDDNAAKINRIYTVEGSLPVNNNEIVIEKTWITRNGNYKIGDMIEITNSVGNSYEYVICGVLRNFSEVEWTNANDEFDMPNAFISQNSTDATLVETVFASVILNKKYNKELLMTQFKNVVFNQYNSLSETSSRIYYKNTGYIYMLWVIIFIIGFFMLYAAYTISVLHFGLKIGMLKIVGLKKRDIMCYFGILHLIQIIPAEILGAITAVIVSPYVIEGINTFVDYYFNIYSIIISLTIVFCVATILLFEGVNKVYKKGIIDEIRISSCDDDIKNVKLSNPYLLYALKNIQVNKRQSTGLVLSIVISVMVLIAGLYSTEYITENFSSEIVADIIVQVYDSSYIEPIEIATNIYAGMEENDLNSLRNSKAVSKILGSKSLVVYSIENEDYNNAYHGMFVTDKEFENSKIKYGYEDVQLAKRVIKGVDDEIIYGLNKYVYKGKINIDKIKKGEEIIVCETEDYNIGKNVGDIIQFTKVIINKSGNVERIDFKSTVGAIIKIDNTENISGIEKDIFSNGFVWSNLAFNNLNLNLNYNNIYININDIESINEINEEITYLQYKYDNCLYLVQQNLQDVETRTELCTTFRAICICVFVVLSLFSMFNASMYIITILNSRKNLFGMLRAVGLMKKDIISVLLTENILQVIGAIFIGVFAGLVLCLLFSISLGKFMLSFFPVGYIIAISLLYVILVTIASIVPINRFIKKSIADCLK